MHLRFRYPRRIQVAPKVTLVYTGLSPDAGVNLCEDACAGCGLYLANLAKALFFTRPVTIARGGAFVVGLFALGLADFELGDPF
jgi:hypothetical protein